MGRQQKLKEMRREMRMQEVLRPKRLWGSYGVALLIAIGVGVIGWQFMVTDKNGNTMTSQTPAPSASAEETMLTPSHTATLITGKGVLTLELYRAVAPKTVDNFVKLTREGFYDGTKFHRVISDFMIQGGDPNSKDSDPSNDGRGGPGYQFADEMNPKSLGLSEEVIKQLEAQGYAYDYTLQSLPVDPSYIAMANAGPNTNGSQFFIVTTKSQPHLYGKHTVFGKVIEGMDVARKIEQGDVLEKVTVR